MSSPFEKEVADRAYEESFLALLDQLSDKKVIIIGPTPRAPFNVGKCIVKMSLLKTGSSCDFNVPSDHGKRIQRLSQILSGRRNVEFVDITTNICPTGRCLMNVEGYGAIYTDSGHLSAVGAELVYDNLNLEFN
ncbi:MAG: hypothetical protein FJ184_09350 [Gammaproteobacteria bacterium]|nr:hypothetical protein [Gammaproteobacteria bacterium]